MIKNESNIAFDHLQEERKNTVNNQSNFKLSKAEILLITAEIGLMITIALIMFFMM